MPSPLLIKNQRFRPGYHEIASPEGSALRWLTVGRLGLLQATPHEHETGAHEMVITVLSGSGHFPQLAHPAAFARCLAETAHWPLAA